MIRSRLASVAAACAAFTAAAASPAFAEESAPAFRAPAAQSFTEAEQERYGVSAPSVADVQHAVETGETIVLTAAEAEAIQAGITDTQWLLIGILVGVVVIAVS